jgi:hypothetical protein
MEKHRIIAQTLFPTLGDSNDIPDNNAHGKTYNDIIEMEKIGKQSSSLDRGQDMIYVEEKLVNSYGPGETRQFTEQSDDYNCQ